LAISNGGLEWQADALCAQPKNAPFREAFFSTDPEDRSAAKNLCFACPVRKECIIWALETTTIWGTWGGRDENEIRRILSVSAEGTEARRGRYPQCPYCAARTSRLRVKIIDLPEGGRWTTAKVVECLVCHTEWRSRSSANAVKAYHTERAVEFARAARKNMEDADRAWQELLAAAQADEEVEAFAKAEMEIALLDTTYTLAAEKAKEDTKEVYKLAKKAARLSKNAAQRAMNRYHELAKIAMDSAVRAKSGPSSPKNMDQQKEAIPERIASF
jgi:WhiB family redox-sensing transcriptional regulator